MRIVGIEHKSGVFEGRPYDNYNIHCLSSSSTSLLKGETCETIKVKVSELSQVFGMVMSESDLVDLFGAEIMPLYMRGNRLVRIDILNLEKKGGV